MVAKLSDSAVRFVESGTYKLRFIVELYDISELFVLSDLQ